MSKYDRDFNEMYKLVNQYNNTPMTEDGLTYASTIIVPLLTKKIFEITRNYKDSESVGVIASKVVEYARKVQNHPGTADLLCAEIMNQMIVLVGQIMIED